MVINMVRKVKKVSKLLLTFISLFSLLLGLLIGATSNYIETRPISDIIINDDLKIHFLELGNDNSGDCILIQAGEYDVLVDAGSKLNSYSTIKGYLDNYIQDDIDLMMSHINSTAREVLNFAIPYDMASIYLGMDSMKKLNLSKIQPDDIILKPYLINKKK